MIPRNQLLFFLLSFLFVSFLFLSLPEKGFTGLATIGPECCQVSENECFDFGRGGGGGDGPIQACLVEDIVTGFCNETTGLCQDTQPTVVPTLNEWGTITVIIALGAAAIVVYRRRRASV